MMENSSKSETTLSDRKLSIYWPMVLFYVYLHCACLYAIFVQQPTIWLLLMGLLIAILSEFGITVGAHRYFAHRSFKANARLKVLLILLQTSAMQGPVYNWVKTHRMHHKYMDTNADPHNSKRGFFFCHMGWLMCRRLPESKQLGTKIYLTDIFADSAVMLQRKYYVLLIAIFGFTFPTIVLNLIANSWTLAWNVNILRFMYQLHATWLVNSAAHLWGSKPYDRNISASQNVSVSILANGEGWHNFHHSFPYDYKAAEGPGYLANLSVAFIDFFAWLGWATDLKVVSENVVLKRMERTGEGAQERSTNIEKAVDRINSFWRWGWATDFKVAFEDVIIKRIERTGEGKKPSNSDDNVEFSNSLWGWGDSEMTEEDKKCVKTIHKTSE